MNVKQAAQSNLPRTENWPGQVPDHRDKLSVCDVMSCKKIGYSYTVLSLPKGPEGFLVAFLVAKCRPGWMRVELTYKHVFASQWNGCKKL